MVKQWNYLIMNIKVAWSSETSANILQRHGVTYHNSLIFNSPSLGTSYLRFYRWIPHCKLWTESWGYVIGRYIWEICILDEYMLNVTRSCLWMFPAHRELSYGELVDAFRNSSSVSFVCGYTSNILSVRISRTKKFRRGWFLLYSFS